jgi:16S rRNA G966 N2-methylase RsmD
MHKDKRIKLGIFYTPPYIVEKAYNLIQPYLSGADVIADISAGSGAFLLPCLSLGIDYIAADYDDEAIEILKQKFSHEKIIKTNSLVNVSREKFKIGKNQSLIIVGNPPYNDTTSLYKKNEKGKVECDEDIYDRDTGIAFLKAYAKLDADVICVLHPLFYLIKETNFKRLKSFKDKYKLKDAYIFSSKEFPFTKTEFPIVMALYKKDNCGMSYEYIRNFEFKLLNSDRKFVLSRYETVDGYINKYPPRKNDPKTSPINVYYYSFRDLNSILRNATFLDKPDNTIVVSKEDFFKYAYLYCLKSFVLKMRKEKDYLFIFSNMSPLISREFVEENKHLFVAYVLNSHKLFRRNRQLREEIFNFYKVGKGTSLQEIEKRLNEYFGTLFSL